MYYVTKDQIQSLQPFVTDFTKALCPKEFHS